MSSLFYPFVFFSLLVFAQPRFETQSSLPDCGGRDKRERICSLGGCNELIISAENGELNSVRALLEKGADVNARSESGHTALMLAAVEGHLEI